MRFVCLWHPDWQTDAGSAAELAPELLAHAPRVVVDDEGCLWVDARGLDAPALIESLLALLRRHEWADVRVGAAATPVAARVAAVHGAHPVTLVRDDASFLAPFRLDVLAPPPSPPLRTLLGGIGVSTCGQLATLDRESVEVRLGAEGARLWELARGDDRRLIFTDVQRALPHASLDWTDYTLTAPERLLFILNALARNVCAALEARGEGAREISLVFSLANGGRRTHALRFARPTASRPLWMRQIRALLGRIVLPDAVTGILLRTDAVAARQSPQGDLFDQGFASARATEQALAELADDQGDVLLAPERSAHPLLEAQTRWVPQDPARLVDRHTRRRHAPPAPAALQLTLQLTLQLLPHPRPVTVVTRPRRDHRVPVRYREGSTWYEIADAAGPDRVSGGQWDAAYAREYFRCVRSDGTLLWLFRDAHARRWYLHGWWD